MLIVISVRGSIAPTPMSQKFNFLVPLSEQETPDEKQLEVLWPHRVHEALKIVRIDWHILFYIYSALI